MDVPSPTPTISSNSALWRTAVIGVAVGVVWYVLLAASPIRMAPLVAAIIFFPVTEELLRLLGLQFVRHIFSTQHGLRVAAAYGLGFALSETVPRWIAAALRHSSPLELGLLVLGPFSSLFVHVGLAMLLWAFISRRKTISGLILTTLLHATHNGYVLLFTLRLPIDFFVTELFARVFVLAGVVAYFFVGRSDAERAS